MNTDRKLSNGLTAIGFVIGIVINRIYSLTPSGSNLENIFTIFQIIWSIFSLWYCFYLYPSLLNRYINQDLSSKFNLSTHDGIKLVSFFNGFCGLLFGFLWNHNLNRSKTGISCYIAGIMYILNLLSGIFILFT